MTKIDKTPVATVPDSRLPQFLRIEREAGDRLLAARIRHPQPRDDGNGRVVQFVRIARGRET